MLEFPAKNTPIDNQIPRSHGQGGRYPFIRSRSPLMLIIILFLNFAVHRQFGYKASLGGCNITRQNSC